ncbi:poly(A)-binding protein binding protein [Coemansia sp. BCRC 34301]|nr:poly(A)-binding protein binding protein [Coemansia sp. BCRC 34301]
MDRILRPLLLARSHVLILQRGLKKKVKIPITLLKDIPRIGQAGAVVHVHKAYMRHELYPKRLADYVVLRTGPLDRSKAEKEVAPDASQEQTDRQEKVHSLALRNQETLGWIVRLKPIVFERSVVVAEAGAEEGAQAIYGSLTKADVLKELAEAHGIVIDKESLTMDDKIKSVGEYTCVVKLIYAGQASFKAVVTPTKDSSTGALGNRTKSQDKSTPVSTQRLIEGEAPEQVEAMHSRLLFLLSYLVGSQVKVVSRDGGVYTGVLESINPNDAQSVVLRYAYSLGSGKATPPIASLVIHGEDCLSISGIAAFGDGGSRENSRTGFKTDADITKASSLALSRELHRWVPDENDVLDSLESGLEHTVGSSKGWDQFATNEQLFGLTTDFDEEIYTTRLDRTRADYKVREREAIRIAQEIQSTPFQNSHVAEERQELAAADDDGGMDEEDRYGAVLRPSGAPGKYVPPYLRGKAEASPPTRQDSAAEGAATAEPQPLLQALPVASVQGDVAGAAQANNAMAVAALAKLNIRMTGHSPALELPRSPPAKPAMHGPTAGPRADSPSLAMDPAITASSKQPASASSSKLANLRGFKHRNDVSALNKPMADITEKLNSERERIQLHKQALLKDRVSDLVKFHKTFKLHSPMPEDVAEIVGARNKSPLQRAGSSASADSDKATPVIEPSRSNSCSDNATKLADLPSVPVAVVAARNVALPSVSSEEAPQLNSTAVPEAAPKSKGVAVDNSKAVCEDPDVTGTEPKKTDKKSLFKFNAKASSFKPSVSAAAFVPKFSAPNSRASSSAGVSEYNPFFGRRILKRAPVSLWGDIIKLDGHQPSGGGDDDAPIWPFGARTYRSQFVADEFEAMMYQPQGFMPQYGGYGYYQPYQYPPQVSMIPPGVAPHMQASSPYTAAAYGGDGGGGGYGGGPYSSAPGYPSPIMVGGDGRSPVITAMNGSAPPTTHPLSHAQGGGTQMAHSGSDSPNVMYGMPSGPPMHMGMVPPPPPMSFNGMQAGGYMGPVPGPHQGYPPQAMAHAMGYPPPAYLAGQQYAASPPNMVMMHGAAHPEQGSSGGGSGVPTSNTGGY